MSRERRVTGVLAYFWNTMGRLQRYLWQLSEGEWAQMWEAAQAELGPVSQALLSELRRARAELPLRGARKELTQRVERWVWRWLWRRSHEQTPIYRQAPPEWVWIGSQAYYRAGLPQEALTLLYQVIARKPWPVEELLLTARWHTEQGEMRAAYRAMRSLEHFVSQLYHRTQQNRLLLLLVRLFEEYGGSYTQPAQRLIRLIARLKRWQDPLPSNPESYAIECNLRGTWALIQGDLQTALSWYSPQRPLPELYSRQLQLNAALARLYAQDPNWLNLLLANPPDRLSLFNRLVWFERLLLGLLSQGGVNSIQTLLPELERIYAQIPTKPDMQLVLIQLRWIAGETIRATYTQLEAFLQFPMVKRRPALSWQAHLVKLLFAVEADEVRFMVQAYTDIQRFLRKHRRDFMSAPTMLRLIRYLYRTRLVHKPFSQAMDLWEAHLQAFPAERYFWRHTILPDWIQARSARQNIHQYFRQRLGCLEDDLESLRALLSCWPPSERS